MIDNSDRISPRFKSKLPRIMNEICNGLLVIEPAIKEMAVPLRDLLDFLDFEIQKVEVQISHAPLNRADARKLPQLNAWLSELTSLRKDFDVALVVSPIQFVREMVKRVDQTFGV
ncbi:hypothetical protein [Bradyrhizobium sp. ARR65]|uniref:hypothetical protein n=1 Tax=Bradyrhizobium sp. ARR65 TaxID=1040989 RepID=UPI00046499A2|nr:hypothetical protein [Bradyrhizobium sp. ARR65]